MFSRPALDLPPRCVLTACLSCSWVPEFPGRCPRSSETWRRLDREFAGDGIPRRGVPALPATVDNGISDLDEVDPWNATTPAVQAFVALFGKNLQQVVRDAMPPPDKAPRSSPAASNRRLHLKPDGTRS